MLNGHGLAIMTDLTIVIPTMNRPSFIKRQLEYYARCCFQGQIIISDSSNHELQAQNTAIIKALNNSLEINYIWTPPLKTHKAVIAASDHISKNYAVLVGDDDFILPHNVQPYINFLESNKAYSAIHGCAVAIRLEPEEYGKLVWAGYYDLGKPSADKDTASERVKQYLSNFTTTVFFIHRTSEWQKIWRAVDPMPDQTFGELLPSCLSVTYGKVKQLNSLYLIRQDHTQRYFGESKYDWISNPEWLNWYSTFRDTIAKRIAEQDNISIDTARLAIQEAFHAYMANCLGRCWADYTHSKKDISYQIRKLLREIPGILKISTYLHNIRANHETSDSIQDELLSPYSPHCLDFLGIVASCNSVIGDKK